MKSKIVSANAENASRVIQPLLDEGWIVTHCVAEQVAATDSRQSGTWDCGIKSYEGLILFILTKA